MSENALSQPGLLDLVGDIYDCAIEPAKWPHALQAIAQRMGGFAATLSLHNPGDGTFRLDAQWNLADDYRSALEACMPFNPALPACWYHDVGQPFAFANFMGPEELRASRYFRDGMSVGGCHDAALMTVTKSASRFGGLGIHRHESQPLYGESDLHMLRLLGPHLQRAIRIADILDARVIERDTLASVLDLLNAGVILTDGTGRIVHCNAAAARHLDDAGALRRGTSVLSGRDVPGAGELRQAIASAGSGTTTDIPKAGITVALKGPGERDLAAWVLPLDTGLRRDFGATYDARVAVFVRELGDTSPFPPELFIRRYGITPAECRLLMLLVQGMTLQDAIATLGVGMATAKTHLSRLFAKTGTASQVELMRLSVSALSPASALPQ